MRSCKRRIVFSISIKIFRRYFVMENIFENIIQIHKCCKTFDAVKHCRYNNVLINFNKFIF